MNLNLSGKKVLVTGASRGIGHAIAKRFLQEGCDVTLVARNASGLSLACDQLRLSHPASQIAFAAADLGDRQALASVFPLLDEVDVLVNSAGAVQRGQLCDTSADVFRHGMDVKVMAAIDLCREACARMESRGGGVIINIIGTSGEKPNPRSVATSTANGALIAFTEAAGCISVDANIRILGISPGLVSTGRTAGILQSGDSPHDSAYAHLAASLPFGRMAHVEEIADLAVFLASPKAGYTSGCVYTVDGGARYRV